MSAPAFAGANDYVFEPVKADVKKGGGVVVSVRLKHKTTGKPVTDPVIVQKRIDMGPDGMGDFAVVVDQYVEYRLRRLRQVTAGIRIRNTSRRKEPTNPEK